VITRDIAHQVLYHYGRADENVGYPPGGFVSRLLSAIAKADGGNRARLALGFPDYVEACDLIESDGGYAALTAIALGIVGGDGEPL
jgi:hypothetical protein